MEDWERDEFGGLDDDASWATVLGAALLALGIVMGIWFLVVTW